MPEGSRERSSLLLRSHGIRYRLAENRSIGDGRRRDPCQGNQLNPEIKPHPQDRAAAFYPQVAIKLPRFGLRDPGGQYQLGGWLKTWRDLESGSLVDTPIFWVLPPGRELELGPPWVQPMEWNSGIGRDRSFAARR
jgi:hypothetical protein